MFDLLGLIAGMDYFSLLIIQWVIIFLLNILPAFAPPTFVILSFFYITHPQNLLILVLIGVTASTVGRFALAKASCFVTEKFANKQKKNEFENINKKLEGKTSEKFFFTFIYSLSPMPSNALFIAFGATKTKLKEVFTAFFFGRIISYLFLIFTTEKIFNSIEATIQGSASIGTIIIEVIGIIMVIAFFLIDWNKLIFSNMGGEEKWPKRNKKLESKK